MNFLATRKVKIVCTLGPSSQSETSIHALIEAGMDVSRLNFSHGTHEFHAELIRKIRKIAQATHKPIGILQDLQGPKLRVGQLPAEGVELHEGDTVLLFPEGRTPSTRSSGHLLIPISAEIARSVSSDTQVNARVLFDDGRIITRVLQVNPPEILIEVQVGGKLTSHKGMNLPGTPLSIPCLTDKDLEDLKFGLSQGVDAIALSFVRSAHDLRDLRQRIRKISNHVPLLIAKIERQEAIECQTAIIEASDTLLIARGDMAVEIGAERVPIIQKELIYACNQAGVPVITATQMLESMMFSPMPTRAEASDVANAVLDGTDAVMLSGETASGRYPEETVRTMSRIVLEAELAKYRQAPNSCKGPVEGSIVHSIEHSAAQIAKHIGAAAIACITHTGMAARTLAKYRPEVPIVAITADEIILRRLSFVWGVRGIAMANIVPTDDLLTLVESLLKTHGWADFEDLIVITAGVPTLKKGTTNMVQVHRMGVKASKPIQED